ncbi:MAG TPA: hypothetical protein VHC40_02385 [Rhizomicrobium sp.]|jgi:hypothetical protein|nr:hypothetical protein [Rhizomicrobium sp.]
MTSYAHLQDKALSALKDLSVPNHEQRCRILWAYEDLAPIPRGGIPDDILQNLIDLDNKMMAQPKELWTRETLPQANLREMSWKKRQAVAEQIVSICAQIFSACGAEQGRHS